MGRNIWYSCYKTILTTQDIICLGCIIKFKKMNGKLIEQWEIDYIRDNYLSKSDKEMSKHLNRSSLTVANTRRKHGYLIGTTFRPFKRHEIEFITLNSDILSDQEIGERLDRSSKSISSWRGRNRLRKRKHVNKYQMKKTIEKMRALIDYCETSKSPPKIDIAKKQLKKLSGL